MYYNKRQGTEKVTIFTLLGSSMVIFLLITRRHSYFAA